MECLSDEQKKLAESGIAMAKAIAGANSRRYPRFRDEFESAAMMGLVRAALSYKENLGSWSSWCSKNIRGYIADVFKCKWSTARTNIENGDLVDIVGCQEEESARGDDDRLQAANLIDELSCCPGSQHHAALCKLIYLEGMSVSEASSHLRFPGWKGYRLHNQAIMFLKRLYEDRVSRNGFLACHEPLDARYFV